MQTICGSIPKQKDVFARLWIVANHIRFTASFFHLTEWPQFFGMHFQLCLHVRPLESLVAIHVFSEASLQSIEKFLAFLR